MLDSKESNEAERKNLNALAEKFGVMNPLNDGAKSDTTTPTSSPVLNNSRRKSVNEAISEIEELSKKAGADNDTVLSLDDALESLEFETSAPHYRTTSLLSFLYKDEAFENNMKRTDLVDIFPFSFYKIIINYFFIAHLYSLLGTAFFAKIVAIFAVNIPK